MVCSGRRLRRLGRLLTVAGLFFGLALPAPAEQVRRSVSRQRTPIEDIKPIPRPEEPGDPRGAPPISFSKSTLGAISISNPTTLQFGPDDRLYMGQQNGLIRIFTVVRNAANSYSATAEETLSLIRDIPNHNDNGDPNPAVTDRQLTGILVTGTFANPVIFACSSDSRIGGGGSGTDLGLDTNSGVLTRLTWDGTQWTQLDLVRGLPRSEENHACNGMQLAC